MKVLLINGSPHEKGCTYTALSLIAGELNASGIETEILNVGTKPVGGCIGCGGCAAGKGCVFGGVVNEAIEKAKTADAFVFGTPVHYASASGNMTSFMDRLAYAGGKYLAYKPAAICASARRAGTTTTLDQLVKYPEFFHMPLVSPPRESPPPHDQFHPLSFPSLPPARRGLFVGNSHNFSILFLVFLPIFVIPAFWYNSLGTLSTILQKAGEF